MAKRTKKDKQDVKEVAELMEIIPQDQHPIILGMIRGYALACGIPKQQAEV